MEIVFFDKLSIVFSPVYVKNTRHCLYLYKIADIRYNIQMVKDFNKKIPKEVSDCMTVLKDASFEVYLVGGCVRDLLTEREPKDWDITTNAKPEEIQKIFVDSLYENNFGTVGVKTESEDPRLKIIEITTYRIEGKYSDARHPDEVKFSKTIDEDLSRRDFTVNSLALQTKNKEYKIVDLFGGQEDIKNKIIKSVGEPEKRFEEDALRMLRAVRFACQLGEKNPWKIEEKTEKAIRKNADSLKKISSERIRDEFQKIIMTPNAVWGVECLRDFGLMKYIVPELLEGVGCTQNKHHIYTVWEHNVRALDYSVSKDYKFEIRLGSLLHDVGKPKTKKGDGPDSTFYMHEYVGATMTRKILERLKFPKNVVDYVTHLVKYHLFYYNVGEVSESGVRRFIARVGEDTIEDLLKIREADRIGSGVPKAVPYKLRHLKFMIEKVKRDPISPKMLKIDGVKIMEILDLKPSRKVGDILNALLDEVIEDPSRNTEKYLEKRARELNKLSEKDLTVLRERAENVKKDFEAGINKEIKQKYKV